MESVCVESVCVESILASVRRERESVCVCVCESTRCGKCVCG